MYKHLLITLLLTITCFLSSCEKTKLSSVLLHTETDAGVLVTKLFKLNSPDEQVGNATFYHRSEDATVHVILTSWNLTPGLHAVHLHDGTCEHIGPHWHPIEVPAGVSGVPVAKATLESPPVGLGEVGNIHVDENGTGTLEFITPFWTIDEHPQSGIRNKIMVIHEAGDGFRSIPHLPDHTPIHTHTTTEKTPISSGGKIACGVIRSIDDNPEHGVESHY